MFGRLRRANEAIGQSQNIFVSLSPFCIKFNRLILYLLFYFNSNNKTPFKILNFSKKWLNKFLITDNKDINSKKVNNKKKIRNSAHFWFNWPFKYSIVKQKK